jgi:hypothetical protein
VKLAIPIEEDEVHMPGSAVIFAVGGHVITGSSPSVTFTVCVHDEVFPLASVAVQTTFVVPTE